MKLIQILSIFVALFLLFTPSFSMLNESRRDKLLRLAGNTALIRKDQRLFRKAFRRVRPFLNDCGPNVCAILDGSAVVGRDNFELQREFVVLLAAFIGANDNASFVVTQTGSIFRPIDLLNPNYEQLVLDFLRWQYVGSPTRFLGGALKFCIGHLLGKTGESAKIVIFGDGGDRDPMLGTQAGPLSLASLVSFFRRRSPANRFCGVAVNYTTKPQFFIDLVGGEKNRRLVTEVDEWPLLMNELVNVIKNICEKPSPP